MVPSRGLGTFPSILTRTLSEVSLGLQIVQRGDGWYVYPFRDITCSELVASLVLVDEHRGCYYPDIGHVLSPRESVLLVQEPLSTTDDAF